ncbi:MAG: elongation factor Ts [Spirochaetaceae bacterium]|nr:MAG: elongation factor Ts [Spirochaetaceae bacterium]
MAISADLVKKLRDKTGAGMMDCKKALVEADGDFQKAEKILKELGLAAAAKREGRATNEGRIFTCVGDSRAAIIEMACETDFVARNESFIALGNSIAEDVVARGVAESDEKIEDKVKEAISTIKENMTLRRISLVEVAENELVADYIHGDGGSIGVLLKLSLDSAAMKEHASVKQFAFDCALHVAAFNPTFLSVETVDAAYLEEQESIFKKQAENLDKPEHVMQGIIKGKMKKHLAEVCLVDQPFVKDDKKSVAAVADAIGKEAGGSVRISDYRYFRVGQETE